MIDWISEWLKNIIIIVLLASFIDLLLPNSNIQKYARMVLSLLVILTIMSPILNIFFKDMSITNIIQQLENQTVTDDKSVMAQLREQGPDQSSYQEKIIQQVETQMTENLTELLTGKFDISIKTVKLQANAQNNQWKIEQVYIGLSKGVEGQDENSHLNNVKEVETVNISIEKNQESTLEHSMESDEEKAMTKEIRQLLQKEWGIPADIIVINYYS